MEGCIASPGKRGQVATLGSREEQVGGPLCHVVAVAACRGGLRERDRVGICGASQVCVDLSMSVRADV